MKLWWSFLICVSVTLLGGCLSVETTWISNSGMDNQDIQLINTINLDDFTWTYLYNSYDYFVASTWNIYPLSWLQLWCTKNIFTWLSTIFVDSWITTQAISFNYVSNCENYVSYQESYLIQNNHNTTSILASAFGEARTIMTFYAASWSDGMNNIRNAINYNKSLYNKTYVSWWNYVDFNWHCNIYYSNLFSTDRYARYVVMPSLSFAQELGNMDIDGNAWYCWGFDGASRIFLQVDRENPTYITLIDAGQDIPLYNVDSLEIK